MENQRGSTTLSRFRGLSFSEFRAELTQNPDMQRGVVVEFADDAACEAFLKAAEAEFAARRFSNVADAFDTVKAYVLERTGLT